MKLEPRARLGPYEILSPAGAGGMGEVWKARDTRLERTVAIKVLPEALSGDAERIARFEREAKLLAQVSHPGIATLHGLEDFEGTRYLVMELVEGETLAARLERGTVPVKEALRIGAQVGDALAWAHRKGVVHRDLKPANIMLAPSGVKLLDFGLAARLDPQPISSDSSALTGAQPLTREGSIVGTFPYMAPEQLQGKEADARTDLFALGAVLYEILTGRRAFDSDSSAGLIASILERDPEPLSSPVLDRVVRKCLAKNPDERWQNASDLSAELRWVAELGAPPAPKPSSSTWALVAAAILLAGIAGWGLSRWYSGPPQSTASPFRLSINLPPGQELATGSFSSIAVSPDGSKIVYGARDEDGVLRLYLRPLESFESTPLPGTEEGGSPFFSPDGTWVGFHAKGRLYKVLVAGGTPVFVTAAPAGFFGASWGEDDTIVFDTVWTAKGLMEVPASGGEAVPLTLSDGSERTYQVFPQILPGSEAVTFAQYDDSFENLTIRVFSRRERESRTVHTTGLSYGAPRYVRLGYLVFPARGALLAAPFDPVSGTLRGAPIQVMEGVLRTTDRYHFDISPGGTLVYLPGRADEKVHRLVWVERNGEVKEPPVDVGNFEFPRLSPDGRFLAIHETRASQIGVYDLARGGRTTLTKDSAATPVWSPEGDEVLYASLTQFEPKLMVKAPFRADEPRLFAAREHASWPTTWSRHGVVGFQEQNPATRRDLWVQPESGEPMLIAGTLASEHSSSFSPDGRFLAYVSDESGRYEVYVVPYPPTGQTWLVSTEGGEEPVWSRDGRDLFYRRGDEMLVASVETEPSFTVNSPRILFEGRFEVAATGHAQNYDVSPDGQRFLMIQRLDSSRLSEIRVVVGFDRELQRLVRAP